LLAAPLFTFVKPQDYQTLFREMLDGFAVHKVLCDEQGRWIDYRFLAVNPAFGRITGLKEAELVGTTVLEAMPSTEQRWIDTYGKVALTGESVFFGCTPPSSSGAGLERVIVLEARLARSSDPLRVTSTPPGHEGIPRVFDGTVTSNSPGSTTSRVPRRTGTHRAP
jgi:PAS domain-containing protein